MLNAAIYFDLTQVSTYLCHDFVSNSSTALYISTCTYTVLYVYYTVNI